MRVPRALVAPRAILDGLAGFPCRAWARALGRWLASLPYREWGRALRARIASWCCRAWTHMIHEGLAPFPDEISPHALRDWLASCPRHGRYPVLSLGLAAAVGVANRIPLPLAAWRLLVQHPAVLLLYELAATGALALALALGAVGLARRDARSRAFASVGMAIAACEVVNVVLGIAPSLALRMGLGLLGAWARLFLWDVPASLFHELAGGELASTMGFFALYLGVLYLVSRHVALCLWRAERPRRWAAAAAGWMRRRWLQLAPRG